MAGRGMMVSHAHRLRQSGMARKLAFCAIPLFILLFAAVANASEAELKIPDLSTVSFLGVTGHNLLVWGLLICILGMVFGFVQYTQIRNLPVHQSMREISELDRKSTRLN